MINVEIIANIGNWLSIIMLFIFSVLDVAVIVERFSFFKNNEKTEIRKLMFDIREKVAALKIDEAIEICELYQTSSSNVAKSALEYLKGRTKDKVDIFALELALENSIAVEKIRINRYLPILASIGSIGPLVGLFGTVLGIMRSFAGITMRSAASQNVIDVAATGIWESLYTTAFGILVAVPALIFYNYLVNRSHNQVEFLHNVANDMITIASENR